MVIGNDWKCADVGERHSTDNYVSIILALGVAFSIGHAVPQCQHR